MHNKRFQYVSLLFRMTRSEDFLKFVKCKTLASFFELSYYEWTLILEPQIFMNLVFPIFLFVSLILGGDFNSPPIMEPEQPYQIIQKYMKNSAAEFWQKLEEWLLPKFATYGNQRNSFSYMYDPITYDYIFHKRLVLLIGGNLPSEGNMSFLGG